MSFILDALKKSESDRQRQTSPALFEVKVAAPRRRFPPWPLVLGVLLGVNVLVLSWVLLRRQEPAPTASAAAPAAAPLAASTPAPAAATAATTPPTANGVQPGTVMVPTTVYVPMQVENPPGSQSIVPASQAAPPAAVTAAGTPPLGDEPRLQDHEQAVPPDYDTRDYRPAITPQQASAIAAARRNGELPSRDDVVAQGSQVPDVRLDLHVYDANPANRFVFINMRKLKEGETLPEGVRVEQITPTGVELSFHGKRFTLDGN
jgi:general secretion pathway protein B